MSKLIQIPFNKGFNSEEDPSIVGADPVEIINLENTKFGTWSKMSGTGLALTITSKELIEFVYYISPSDGTTLYWIGYDQTNKKIYRFDSSFGSTSEISVVALSPDRIQIKNWGKQMRFANGLTNDPSIYQYIDRDFFYNGTDYFYEPTPGFDYDTKAYPRKPTTWSYFPVSAEGVKGEVQSGGSLTQDRDYYYKMVPVFDGNQEAILTDDKFGPLTTTATHKGCKLQLLLDTADFNKRITHCKIYRADTSAVVPKNPEYSLIKTIDFTASATSWINSSAGYLGRKIFAESLTVDLSSFPDTTYWSTSEIPTSLTNTFTKASNNKFLWSSTDVDGDKWGETLDTTKYVFTGNTNLFTNPGFTGSSTGWTLGGDASYSSNQIVFSEVGTGADGGFRLVCYQDVTCPTGTTHLSLRCSVEYIMTSRTDGHYFQTTTTGGVTIDTGSTNRDTTHTARLSTGGNTTVRVKFYKHLYYSTGYETAWVDDFYAFPYIDTYTSGYTHQSMFAIDNSGIADSSGVGKDIEIGGLTYTVTHNQGDIFRVSGSAGWITSASTSGNTISGLAVIYDRTAEDPSLSATQTRMQFTDVGEVEGSYHPYSGTTSLNTKFKHSTSANGRQFVGNVKITSDDGTSEEHGDMILFSEFNKPDVIPISNFIKLNDLQGGDIFGLAGLFSDIVVFAERGIFRLSVPQVDPTSWSLVEAEKNIGCNQPYSITEYRGGVFFAGNDNLYYIDPNFQFYPISQNWKSQYQSDIAGSLTYEEETTMEIDPKKQRLIVQVGDEHENIKMMDLRNFPNETIWYSRETATGNIHNIIRDNENNLNLVTLFGGNTVIRPLVDSGSSESFTYSYTTGYISLTKLGDPTGARIRRISYWFSQNTGNATKHKIILKSNHSSTDEISSGADVDEYEFDPTHSKNNHYTFKPTQRSKMRGFQLTFTTGYSSSLSAELKNLEIEID